MPVLWYAFDSSKAYIRSYPGVIFSLSALLIKSFELALSTKKLHSKAKVIINSIVLLFINTKLFILLIFVK